MSSLKLTELIGLPVVTKDASLGQVDDVMIDVSNFDVRYLVISMKKWLPSEKVLIAPGEVAHVTGDEDILSLDLLRKDVENAPKLPHLHDVPRTYELSIHDYFGWTPYWLMSPSGINWYPKVEEENETTLPFPEEWNDLDEHRRKSLGRRMMSAKSLKNFSVKTFDDAKFGHIENLIIDTDDWFVLDCIVSENRLLPGGHHYCFSPRFIEILYQHRRLLQVSFSKDRLEFAPQYDSATYGENFRRLSMEHYLGETGSSVFAGTDDHISRDIDLWF